MGKSEKRRRGNVPLSYTKIFEPTLSSVKNRPALSFLPSLFGTVILAAAAEAATQLLRTVCFLLAPRGRNLSERSRVHFPPVLSPLQPPAIKRNTHSSGDVFSPFEKIVIQVFLWNYNGLRILSRLVLLSQGRVVEDALASSPAVGLRT